MDGKVMSHVTRHYRRELDALGRVYSAALCFDISPIVSMVESLIHLPVITVGSGGSFSTASFAADLHQRRTRQLARATTPLDLVSGDVPHKTATICFSASGRNRDIGAAFKLAAQQESGPVGALVLSDNTPLHKLQRQYSYTDVVGGDNPAFRDGFLAVATMFASLILLTRAYDNVLGSNASFPDTFDRFLEISLSKPSIDNIAVEVEPVLARKVTSLLFSPVVRSSALDLESRFVEGAFESIHIADFRNFGHGRHHWMARQADKTGVLAIVSDRDKLLADRTLDLIPDNIPMARVDLKGPVDFQAIAALVTGLYVSEVAAQMVGIDPGKPGVPDFGRKLYRLGPRVDRMKASQANQRAAIKRKAPDALRDAQQFDVWAEAHQKAIEKLSTTHIGAVVFDYDGTLCDKQHRFTPLLPRVGKAISKLCDDGIKIAIATGRGASAGQSLKQSLSPSVWKDVIIGYYNGAMITSLADEEPDMPGDCQFPELVQALGTHPVLAGAKLKSNAAQISIRLPSSIRVSSAVSAVEEVLSGHRMDNGRINSSSHSIDIQLTSSSKTSVVEALKAGLDNGLEVLRIGDKGIRPGNDADLLDSPLGLSVGEASRHFTHCWALAPAGVKGVQATLYYLSKLDASKGGLCIQPGDRGDIDAV